jgi:enoyl-CoA hydratase/carnithine racemase
MNFQKIRLDFPHGARVGRVTLAAPKANVIDCALGFACRAARLHLRRALAEDLPALESLYLHDLMSPDAVEGIRAFLEKRPAPWNQPEKAVPA